MTQHAVRITLMIHDPETGEMMREICHPSQVSEDDRGVEIRWGDLHDTFIPWTSIAKIDREPVD